MLENKRVSTPRPCRSERDAGPEAGPGPGGPCIFHALHWEIDGAWSNEAILSTERVRLTFVLCLRKIRKYHRVETIRKLVACPGLHASDLQEHCRISLWYWIPT